jgi:hypothetical protein
VKQETKAQKAQRKPVESGGTKADIFEAQSNMKSAVCSSELSSVDGNNKTPSRERSVPDSFYPPEAEHIIFDAKTLEKKATKKLKKSLPTPLVSIYVLYLPVLNPYHEPSRFAGSDANQSCSHWQRATLESRRRDLC